MQPGEADTWNTALRTTSCPVSCLSSTMHFRYFHRCSARMRCTAGWETFRRRKRMGGPSTCIPLLFRSIQITTPYLYSPAEPPDQAHGLLHLVLLLLPLQPGQRPLQPHHLGERGPLPRPAVCQGQQLLQVVVRHAFTARQGSRNPSIEQPRQVLQGTLQYEDWIETQ